MKKSLGVIRREVKAGRLPNIFEKRELFHIVSRFIFNLDNIPSLAGDNPDYQDLGKRIVKILGPKSFGQQIFDDPVISKVSMVGRKSPFGRLTKNDFLALHKALREGNFVGANEVLSKRKIENAPSHQVISHRTLATRLILHVGLQETGTTALQHELIKSREGLLSQGILVPETGLNRRDQTGMPNTGQNGHQSLLKALRKGDRGTWDRLYDEIRQSVAHTTILSCENMLMPLEADRNSKLEALFDHLSFFEQIDIVALAQNPATWIEALYREYVASGRRDGSCSFPEFVARNAGMLLDFPELFGPLEKGAGKPITFADFDQLKRGPGLWQGFLDLLNIKGAFTQAADRPVCTTLDRDSTQLLRMLNLLVEDESIRMDAIRSYFALNPIRKTAMSVASPQERSQLLESWQSQSAAFAGARGYAPDLDAMRDDIAKTPWAPLAALPNDKIEDLILAVAQSQKP